jgi:tetratricopeptide (TPR) repeat protein
MMGGEAIERQETEERLSDLLGRAEALAAQGRWEDAESILLALFRRNPDYADICNRLGYLYHQRGDLARAREFYERSVRLNPDYTEASLNLALALNELGLYEEAKQVVHRAQDRVQRRRPSLDPYVAGKLANRHLDLGDVYRELGLLSEAAEQYSKALSLSPHFSDIQVKLGVTLREMGSIDEAIEALTKAAVRRPDFADARIQLGITYFSKGFMDRAIAEWSEALRINPQNRKAAMYLSFVQGEKQGDKP